MPSNNSSGLPSFQSNEFTVQIGIIHFHTPYCAIPNIKLTSPFNVLYFCLKFLKYKQKKVKMKSLSLIIVVSGLIILSTGCGITNESEQTKALRYVKISTAAPKAVLAEKYFNATIEENRQSSVAFRVGGPLDNIYFKEGDFVKKDELLAQLDQRDFKTRLQAAEAQYKQAKAEFERYTQLFEQRKLPANTHDKMKSAYLAAKSNWENAKNALADTELKAPFSGFVFQKLVNNHETISPGQPVLIIIDTNTLEVNFGVPETVVNQLKEGQNVEVTINHHPNNRFPASIKSVSHKAEDDRLFNVRLEMANPDPEKIKPGMTAKAFIKNDDTSKQSLLFVPTEAIFYLESQANVWIYNSHENRVTQRSVKTGEITGNGMIEITHGLNSGEMIVTAGVHSLIDGQKVKPLSQNALF
jgi:RND family efflux transporter MFP subunit